MHPVQNVNDPSAGHAEQPDEGSRRLPGDPENSCTHRVDIGSDLIVRKAHDIEAHPLQVTSAIAIADLAFVLSAIDLDDQLRF